MTRLVSHHLPELRHTIILNGLAPLTLHGMLAYPIFEFLPDLGIKWHKAFFKINSLLREAFVIIAVVDGVSIMTKRLLETRANETLQLSTQSQGVLFLNSSRCFLRSLRMCFRLLGRAPPYHLIIIIIYSIPNAFLIGCSLLNVYNSIFCSVGIL
jgi:hypothetical protein